MSTLNYYGQMVGHHDQELYPYYYDMMPYTENGRQYYTGQFTSRPNIKAAARKASSVLSSANKLFLASVAGSKSDDKTAQQFMRAA